MLEKAPAILAGTPQQSNVALLALHARLFLPPEALSSFDAMPALPVAQTLTRVAQALGVLALWRLTATRWGGQRDWGRTWASPWCSRSPWWGTPGRATSPG